MLTSIKMHFKFYENHQTHSSLKKNFILNNVTSTVMRSFVVILKLVTVVIHAVIYLEKIFRQAEFEALW